MNDLIVTWFTVPIIVQDTNAPTIVVVDNDHLFLIVSVNVLQYTKNRCNELYQTAPQWPRMYIGTGSEFQKDILRRHFCC